MELLERQAALDALQSALAAARGGEGRLLLIAGEAGVGKTALLRTFGERQPRAVRLLWGRCEPVRTPGALSALLDVADSTEGEVQELLEAGARPHEVVLALLRELRRRIPTVLVLEDLHWADEATLDLLTLLAARVADAPALVLGTYRNDELAHAERLRLILGELTPRPERLRLEPLSARAVAELAQGVRLDPAELHRKTGGNPFFVTEVLSSSGAEIPDSVRDAVLARISRLSAPARRVLEAVAVTPGDSDLGVLEAITAPALEPLDECLASGVLTAGRRSVAFRHELARLAVEGTIAPHRRLDLHRRVLDALRARAPAERDAALLAYHAEAAGDDAGVRAWAPAAAEAAARSGAHREAAAQFARALRAGGALPAEQRAALLGRRAHECYMTAAFDDAIAAQREALDEWRRLGDARATGDALRALSRLLFFAGRPAEAEPLALEAVAVLEQLPAGHELAMAYANLSQRCMVVQDTEGAVRWGTRALALAADHGDVEAKVYASINVGAAEYAAQPVAGADRLRHAAGVARREGLEEYAGRALMLLALCPLRMLRPDLVDPPIAAGLEFCIERGLDTWRLYLLALRSRIELMAGEWDRCRCSAELVLGDPRSAQLATSWTLCVIGTLRARLGEPDAFTALDAAQALVSDTDEVDRIALVAAARAEALWLQGDDDAVVEVTGQALAMAVARRYWPAVDELAYWRWQAGHQEQLDGGELATPYRLSLTGEWAAAAEQWRTIGAPYEAALAETAAEDPAVARAGVERLQRLGARPAAALLARRLRERGVRGIPRGPRPATRANPSGLTARELEVLELVADGLRNTQIAQRLVVSDKTVDHHVSAILRKLGARSRSEAAAIARREGIAGVA